VEIDGDTLVQTIQGLVIRSRNEIQLKIIQKRIGDSFNISIKRPVLLEVLGCPYNGQFNYQISAPAFQQYYNFAFEVEKNRACWKLSC